MEGQVIARDQPDASGIAMGYDHLVPLQVAWDGLTGWHVTILSAAANDPGYVEPSCASAQDEVNMNFALRNVTINDELVDWRFIPATVRAAGCLVIAVPRQSGVSTPTPSPHMTAYFLHRFGLLLAANDLAHRIWRNIPVADAYEQKLAQQLATSHTL